MATCDIPPDSLLGGRIRLIARIGRGGMGDVWRARNEATEAEVAVKTLHRVGRSTSDDERFRREARLSATISHRNVVRVFDLVDEADGTLGLVMELLRGATLEDVMSERGPLTSVQAVAIAVPVLSAMHHVHQRGIVHRDVKPANVFLAVEPDGHVVPKILDFGIAKLPAAGAALTVDGSVLGTPHYMSPEQIRGQSNLDGRSDMFSFAVVLYEMLTGDRVFHREAPSASLAAVLEHDVDPDPRIEPRLWIALSRALAKRPYERQASCAELASELRASVAASDVELAHALEELGVREAPATAEAHWPSTSTSRANAAPLVEASGPAPRPRSEPRTLAFAAMVAFAAVVFGIVLALAISRSRETPAAAATAPPPLAVSAVPPAVTALPPAVSALPPAVTALPPAVTALPLAVSALPPAVATASSESGLPSVPSAVTTARAAPKRAPAAERARKPRGSPAGIATTPGF